MSDLIYWKVSKADGIDLIDVKPNDIIMVDLNSYKAREQELKAMLDESTGLLREILAADNPNDFIAPIKKKIREQGEFYRDDLH